MSRMNSRFRHAVVLFFVVGFPLAGSAQAVAPNLTLTPGVARPLSKATICKTKWGLDARHVTDAMKKQAFAAYGIPWEQHSRYEVDHLISRELGGADDVKNLWPEPWYLNVGGKEMGARQKDQAENKTHKALCDGKISLKDAQQGIAEDWTMLYKRFVHPDFPASTH